MELSYLLLLVTCFFYGATQLIEDWDDFGTKLINVLVILTIIVLLLITAGNGFTDDSWWWRLIALPGGIVYLGLIVGESISDWDWNKVFMVLACIGLVATIITTCCGL